MVEHPRDLNETEHMVAVHESFKTNFERKSVLAVSSVNSEDQEPTTEVRRVSDKRLVTEERLQVFGRELKQTITAEVTDKVTASITPELKDIKSMLNRKNNARQAGGLEPRIKTGRKSLAMVAERLVHIKRFCPKLGDQQERSPANQPSDNQQEN